MSYVFTTGLAFSVMYLDYQGEHTMTDDARHIVNGRIIPSHFYADQPYVLRTDDGAWLCVMTTGEGREGAGGQFVITQRSIDKGNSWTDEARMEPIGAPANSWGVLLKAPTGRLFCFYVFNADDLQKVPADPGSDVYPDGFCYRVDSLGEYVFRYSDDQGRTWSNVRVTVPVREFDIDRNNPSRGDIRYFWNVGKPFIDGETVYASVHKVGGFGAGFFTSSEGVLVASSDLLSLDDPSKATWETLPLGDAGIRAPDNHGRVAEEHSYSVLSDGSFFTVFRTISGFSACAYSRDRGRTWSAPQRMQFSDGRPIKNPRAANFAWRCENGRYLYWFHNNGGEYVHQMQDINASFPYCNRNPVWLSGGVETDSPEGRVIMWSEPEIALYDDDPMIRMSYPDLLEEDGEYYLSETQKDVARVHRISRDIIDGLWNQFGNTTGPAPDDTTKPGASFPALPLLTKRDTESRDYRTADLRSGFCIDMELEIGLRDGLVFDNLCTGGQGIGFYRTADDGFRFEMSDGQYSVSAPLYGRTTESSGKMRITILVDGGPKIISAVCNGVFLDGGEKRQFGWTRYSPYLSDVNSSSPIRTGSGGAIVKLSVYRRCLRVSEAIALQKH